MNYDFNRPEQRLAYIDAHGSAAYNAEMQRFRSTNTIEICNGHELVRVSTRFGELIQVGSTGRAFRTIEEARTCAQEHTA